MAEGSSRPVDANDRQIPHPTRTAIRGIAEELEIDVQAEDIHWISFGANTVLCEYGLIGWIRIAESWADLERRRQAGLPKDTWESARLYAVPMTPKALADFVRNHQPWSPFALVALFHTLLAHFRWEEVNAAWQSINPVLSE